MKIQHSSSGFRYGDTNPQHIEALTRVVDFWNKFSSPKYSEWVMDYEWIERYDNKFIRDMKLDRTVKDHFEHTPDLVFYEWISDQPVARLIIEVDGESHDKTERKLSDGYFKEWLIRKYQGKCTLIRIQKRELVGDLDLAHEELENRLSEYIKK